MKVLCFFRKKLITILFLLFTVLLVVFSNSNFYAARNGLSLWANNVIPSLFPFLIAVELLKQTNIVYFLSNICDKYMRPLFNLPGIASFPLFMGFLSGYPVGAKIVADLYSQNACTKDEAERMLPLTNNSGPLFIIGTVGIAFFGSSLFGFILLGTHIFSSLTSGILLGIQSRRSSVANEVSSTYSMQSNENISISELGGILNSSIMNSIKTVLLIGGFVTLFSVIISIIEKTQALVIVANGFESVFGVHNGIITSFISGIVEFTNGVSKLSAINVKDISTLVILSSFVIGFGGFSVYMQVLSIVSKHSLSMKKYFVGKLLQGFIAMMYTALVFLIPFFNLNV